MLVENYLGKIILLKVQAEFIQLLPTFFGFKAETNGNLFYAKVVNSDELGVYVENPKWSTSRAGQEEQQKHVIQFLIPWNQIITYAVFPDGKSIVDQADDKTPTLGFQR
jgi:hypothetical protein